LRGSVGRVADYPSMRTPDGVWRVEVYRQPSSSAFWYRLVNVEKDNVLESLTIATVQRLLDEAGVDIADLVEDAA
jgi:bifunctional non-homologous end joining protein LigD